MAVIPNRNRIFDPSRPGIKKPLPLSIAADGREYIPLERADFDESSVADRLDGVLLGLLRSGGLEHGENAKTETRCCANRASGAAAKTNVNKEGLRRLNIFASLSFPHTLRNHGLWRYHTICVGTVLQ